MSAVDHIALNQFAYPRSLDEAVGTPFERAHRLFGTGDVEGMFKGAPKDIAPWPKAGRQKSSPLYDQSAVSHMLGRTPVLEPVSPLDLHATQPWVTHSGVTHYMDDDYLQTGRTFAEQGNVGNAYPVVYSDQRGRNHLLSGHHRATAALLRGVPLQARRVRGSI